MQDYLTEAAALTDLARCLDQWAIRLEPGSPLQESFKLTVPLVRRCADKLMQADLLRAA